jgi:hypothetical protein
MDKFLTQITTLLHSKSPLYLRVKVLPKSPKNEIVDQLEDETYKIRISAPAMDGKANAELIKFLKKSLGVSEVLIVSGQTAQAKLLRISR